MPAAALSLLALVVGTAAAEPVPTAARDTRTALALTVYGDDLALVRDTREVALPAGESRLRIADVAARIDPRTVALRSLTDAARLRLVEQTSPLELLSPQALLERAVGREVELVETDARLRTQVTRATLLSAEGGGVYRVGDRVVVGPAGRVVLADVPDDLTARPTLLWRLRNEGPDRHRIELTYLTGGLSWDADYALTLGADPARADVDGWATIANQSGVPWPDAAVTLVAGQLHRVAPPAQPMLRQGRQAALAATAPPMAEEQLFEYHAYTPPRPVTLAEAEATRLHLVAAQGVTVRRTLVVLGEPTWARSPHGDTARELPVRALVELRNEVGQPLPAGIVRLYQRGAKDEVAFIGEDTIAHTPEGEKITLEAGTAFDVKATRRQTDFRAATQKPFEHEVGYTITLRNRKAEPVTVLVREPMAGEWKVLQSSHPPETVDARTLGFTVEVPANGETTVSYRAAQGAG